MGPAEQLSARRIEKPWGRRDLGSGFEPVPPGGAPVGEIVFDNPAGGPSELLLKYLFTSEKLSIQVHPSDDDAAARGLPNGKDEAWLVLEADPGATLGIGLRGPASREDVKAAALAGTIEEMVDWRPVEAGQCIYSPAGTIHAIGPGVALVEVQQTSDVTYRLYDYGRPRELHLEEGLAVARLDAHPAPSAPVPLGSGRTRLASGPAFQMERLDGPVTGRIVAPGVGVWLLPLAGAASLGRTALSPGSAWVVREQADLRLEPGAQVMIAYPGGSTLEVWDS
jgi:mannose-6-phosphate isomerase